MKWFLDKKLIIMESLQSYLALAQIIKKRGCGVLRWERKLWKVYRLPMVLEKDRSKLFKTVRKKLQGVEGWHGKLLSMFGKKILIKTVT